jgi:hypothetical protein
MNEVLDFRNALVNWDQEGVRNISLGLIDNIYLDF